MQALLVLIGSLLNQINLRNAIYLLLQTLKQRKSFLLSILVWLSIVVRNRALTLEIGNLPLAENLSMPKTNFIPIQTERAMSFPMIKMETMPSLVRPTQTMACPCKKQRFGESDCLPNLTKIASLRKCRILLMKILINMELITRAA